MSSPFDFLIALDDEEPLLFAEKDRFARCYVKFFEELSAQNSVLNPVIPTNTGIHKAFEYHKAGFTSRKRKKEYGRFVRTPFFWYVCSFLIIPSPERWS